jgi:hypothetical protein
MTDTDSPWKEILEHYFEPFMALFFSEAHAEIDWERGHEFLDKELQQITREAEIGKRTVDKLVKVWLKDGKETWILVHMEVQSREDLGFEERMFVYHYRIFDRYRRQVVSLAVLADEKEPWRPTEFSYGRWGCEMQFRFPVVKLLDFRKESGRLQAAKGNPFAVVVEAHLLAMATRRDADTRLESKFQLIKRLYMEGYGKQEIVDLFRFIDWIMDLPEGRERLFWEELAKYEEGKKMAYVSSVERIGMEKGLQKGIQQGMIKEAREMVQEAISSRFGNVPEDIAREIDGFENRDILKVLLRQAIVCSDLTVFRKALKEARC